jgi:hypothetical protein
MKRMAGSGPCLMLEVQIGRGKGEKGSGSIDKIREGYP